MSLDNYVSPSKNQVSLTALTARILALVGGDPAAPARPLVVREVLNDVKNGSLPLISEANDGMASGTALSTAAAYLREWETGHKHELLQTLGDCARAADTLFMHNHYQNKRAEAQRGTAQASAVFEAEYDASAKALAWYHCALRATLTHNPLYKGKSEADISDLINSKRTSDIDHYNRNNAMDDPYPGEGFILDAIWEHFDISCSLAEGAATDPGTAADDSAALPAKLSKKRGSK